MRRAEFRVTVTGRVDGDDSGFAEIGRRPLGAPRRPRPRSVKVTEDDGVTTLRLTWPL